MRTLLLAFAILHLALSSGCPDLGGWELVKDGECRGLHSRSQTYFDAALQQAIDRCASIDGKPMIIHDQEHQDYWWNRMPTDGFAILGLVCNKSSTKWQWSDGSPLDFKPPAGKYNIELDKPCTEGFSWDMHSDGYWSYGSEGPVKAVYFCTTQLEQPAPASDGCEGFADDKQDGVCYQVGSTAQSWQDAQMSCLKFGANLASIHSKQENAFVRRLATARGATNGMFLGASAGKDGAFGWFDRTQMDYEDYYPGFPKKNFGECLAMDTTETAGQWMNIDCAAKLPFACTRQQREDPAPVCTGEDYDEGAIITTPGFPFSANTSCEYFLAVQPGKIIEVEVIFLEANSCCDKLVFYDAYIGGRKIAELTGEGEEVNNKNIFSSTNIMRVSWQPAGGVNVKGAVFKYRTF